MNDTRDPLARYAGQSLHEALAAHGLDSRKERDAQRRTVFRRADGAVVGSFTAHEAWDWLAAQDAAAPDAR